MIVLDTAVLIKVEKGDNALINRLEDLKAQLGEELVLTAPGYAEALHGFVVIGKQELGEEFLHPFDVIPFDTSSARTCALLKHDLEKSGNMIPAFDLMIASIAMISNSTLVSFDKHFERVAGLKLILLQG